MSLFRQHFDDMNKTLQEFRRKPLDNHMHIIINGINNHLEAVQTEFKIEKSEIKELEQYYKILNDLRTMAESKSGINTSADDDERHKFVDQIEDKMKELHNIVIDLERSIRKEFGVAHKFLE